MMKTDYWLMLLLVWGLVWVSLCQNQVVCSPTNADMKMSDALLLGISFTENAGQWPAEVRFRGAAGPAATWFTEDGVYHQLVRITRPAADGSPPLDTEVLPEVEWLLVKAQFVGSQGDINIVGEQRLPGKSAFFLGDDPSRWRKDVSSYQSIFYQEVYPGVDVRFYHQEGRLKYDFLVAPGADPSQIRIRYRGVDSLWLDASGSLQISTGLGVLSDASPVGYSVVGRQRSPLSADFVLLGDRTYGFAIEEYDASMPLIIDPSLTFSTYLGGSSTDLGFSLAVDSSGCIYVTGDAVSADFPTQNPYQTHQGSFDGFVSKIQPESPQSLVYSTYIGGSSLDFFRGLALDDSGCVYVTGFTRSSNFPTVNPYQASIAHPSYYDAFVAKLDADGDSLIYSTYLGGGTDDYGFGIAVDSSGKAYVTGYTKSTNFPTVNPFQTDPDGVTPDVFVSKLTAAGSGLHYSTYIGGTADDRGFGIAVDGSGQAHLTGQTGSANFPTQNPLQAAIGGGTDAFVIRMTALGNVPLLSTFFGGSGDDIGRAIALDGLMRIYFVGQTASTNFPLVDPLQYTLVGGSDACVSLLTQSGDSVIFSTYLGGGSDDVAKAIDPDDDCQPGLRVWIAGETNSVNFPVHQPLQTNQPQSDAFAICLNVPERALLFSTYLGGDGYEGATSVAALACGKAAVTGGTSSTNFPTADPLQDTLLGSDDAFVSLLLYCADADLDAVCDEDDNCPVVYNPDQEDADEDGSGDSCDVCTDLDDDGYGDPGFPLNTCDTDNCPADYNPDQNDADGDGAGDSCDVCTDLDGDGFGDPGFPANTCALDNCPAVANPLQEDADLDGTGDSCDVCTDSDGDGYGDPGYPLNTCETDNCPTIKNPDQNDADGDGMGDSCDVCTDTDGDGFGDPGYPANTCTLDNCVTVFNPAQEDDDSDGVGDSCDICPQHPEDDCCNPTSGNAAPEIISLPEVTVVPDSLPFIYVAEVTDLNCDGEELVRWFESYPSWCSVSGDTLSGLVGCDFQDTGFVLMVSDGDLGDTLAVSILVDLSNQAPVITDDLDTVYIRNGKSFSYSPAILDPDDSLHLVTYLNQPPWCTVVGDTVTGVAPDSMQSAGLTVVAADYCGADTLSFLVAVYLCGDADGNGLVNVSDAVYLIGYIFGGGPGPVPLLSGDLDCNDLVNVSDAVYVIGYIFGGGQEPCADCLRGN